MQALLSQQAQYMQHAHHRHLPDAACQHHCGLPLQTKLPQQKLTITQDLLHMINTRENLLCLDSGRMLKCRAFITETLIPPKDDEDTEESNDKSDFRDFISNWLDKFRGNKTEMDKVWLPVM